MRTLDSHIDLEDFVIFAMRMGRERALSGKRSMVSGKVIIAELVKIYGKFFYRNGHARMLRSAYGYSYWNTWNQRKK